MMPMLQALFDFRIATCVVADGVGRPGSGLVGVET